MNTTLELDPQAPHAQPRPAPRWAGPLAGFIAAFVAIGVGWLVAAAIDVVSPLDAVGSEFIDNTPHWLKVQAIRWFGTSDKTALRVGMVVTIALLALVVGAIARRRPRLGVAAIIAFGVLGAVVAAGRPGEGAAAALAPLLGAAAGAAVLWFLSTMVRAGDPTPDRPGPSRAPQGWDRRRFVQASGAAAGVAAVATAIGRGVTAARESDQRAASNVQLPTLATAPTGGTLPVSPTEPVAPEGAQLFDATPFITPNKDFYLIDTTLSLPRVDLKKWTLTIDGMVSKKLSLTYDDLLARPMVERTITIACVSNEVGGDYIGNAVWQGVALADLLREAGVDPAAEQVFGTSVDGWTCGFPVSAALDGRDAIIAVGMNGKALPPEHGFPARVIVPGLYGYVSATKWVQRLSLTTWAQAEGYWVPRGWARDAPVKTQSRIDVPRRGDRVPVGRTAIAGVAWAQHRGVTKVEVSIDGGPWAEARLGKDVSIDAWRQWAYDWDATPGDHEVRVRATDATGVPQTDQIARPDPDGATGYHTRRITVST